ncbi:MAG: carbon starvation protein A [Nitrospinota bacterium]
MNAALILGGSILVFLISYFTYGRYVSRLVGLDDSTITPAHKFSDGVDYVAAPTPVVIGHHFASVAGAGPIVGPIIALYFGWLPGLLWILFGSVFVGAVHDFISLVASMRHEGRSVGCIIERYIGRLGKKLFLIFSFSALILVIAVFARIVVATLLKQPEVATASVLFVALALIFGQAVNRFRVPLLPATIAGVALMALCVWIGITYPLLLSEKMWFAIVMIYIFLTSIAPVSLLLQPRDYLNSYLLIGVLIMAVFGIFVYQPTMAMPAFTSFNTELGLLFPMLFVTIACGAVSGFHSLVSSGTSSKQINRESDARIVGYGSMLVEGVLAVVALITASYLAPSAFASLMPLKSPDPISVFANGVGNFSTALGIPVSTGVTFAAMAISSFALTTLDTCVRLARFAFQEYFTSSADEQKMTPWVNNPITGTALAVGLGLAMALSGGAGFLWPVFGASNQLLGALALLAASVWLERTGRKSLFVKIPMVIMFAISLTALLIVAMKNIDAGNWIIAALAVALFGFGSGLAALARVSLKKSVEPASEELVPETNA